MGIRREWIDRQIQQGTDVILQIMGKTEPSAGFILINSNSSDEAEKPVAPSRPARKEARRKRKRRGK